LGIINNKTYNIMVYIIAARKATPNFPAHATRCKSRAEAEKLIKNVYNLKINWLVCEIVEQNEYELICKKHPRVAANTRCNDTMEKI
jgi:hypothetical protein